MEVFLHQALCGYHDGHRLLASSVAMPRHVESLLTVLSDLSGPAGLSAFDSYLSGFPIQEMNCYALGRTWYAHEMSRPGCVWTHLILLPFTVLDKVANTQVFDCLFSRPESKVAWDDYQRIIPFTIQESVPNSMPGRSPLTAAAIRALYEHPDQPVLAVVNDVGGTGIDVYQIWSMQWPELRHRFTFSTFSLATRKLLDQPFDLQVVPRRTLLSIQRVLRSAVVVDVDNAELSCESWPLPFECIADETLRWQEYCRVGREFPASRKWLPAVVALSYEDNPASALRMLASGPGRHLIPDLAAMSITSITGNNSTIHHDELLRQLFVLEGLEVDETSAISEAAKRMAALYPSRAVQLIRASLHVHVNSLGQTVLHSLAQELAHDPKTIANAQSAGIMPLLIPLNPAVCLLVEAWQGEDPCLREMLDVVAHLELADQEKAGVLAAILDAKKDAIAADVVRIFCDDAVFACLNWVNHEPDRLLSREWRIALCRRPSDVAQWLRSGIASLQPTTMRLLTEILDPRDPSINDANYNLWLASWQQMRHSSHGSKLDRCSAYLMTLGLRRLDFSFPRAELVAAVFPQLHDALIGSRLPYDVWTWLSPFLPNIGWWRDWDKAERLRRAVLSRFVQCQSAVKLLAQVIAEDWNWRFIIETCDNIPEGKHLLLALSDAISDRVIPSLDDSRAAAVRSAARKIR